MVNKNIVIGIILTIILVVGYFLFSTSTGKIDSIPQEREVSQKDNQSSPSPQSVNKQASFAIFTNGTFREFSAAMYHNLSQDVYIEANKPNIIKIRKEGITWNDFFSTLPFKLTHACLTTGTKETFCTNEDKTLKFYLNGERKEQILDQLINNGDKLLITYGNESEGAIEKQLIEIPNP